MTPEHEPMFQKHQQAEWDRIQRASDHLGRLITNYQRDYRITPDVILVRGIDETSQPFTEVHTRSENG